MKYLAKVADAELAWQEKATKIRTGQQKSMLTILEERGLVQTITGYDRSADIQKFLLMDNPGTAMLSTSI